MNHGLLDPTLNLYTPQAQSPEQLLAEFIDRKDVLKRILDILRRNTRDKPQQHAILLGPRGMGKTTLLCAIRHSVNRDPALNAEWLPLQFFEEQYNIGDLADFWLECLRHLEQEQPLTMRTAEQLLDSNPGDLAEQARARFFELLAATGKRALLLVDNLQEIFAAIDDGHALHQLRALWMTDPRMTVIGAAPSYFEEITDVDQAFHDFFRAFTLERLNQAELETCLRRYAEILQDDIVPQVIERSPERVAALRILTGGNPRLVKLGYRVLREGLDGDVRSDLERLLDEATPFFKHRIDSLAKEARRAFDAIAKRWDPVTVDDIRRELRKRYQVSERFYNLYYLWRLSRDGRKRLRWLVGFMRVFYGPRDYREWSRRLETELAGPVSEPVRAEKLAHLHALCAAADEEERDEVFDILVRDAITHDDRRALDEEATEGNPVETHGWRYLVAEVVWLLEPTVRKQLCFTPKYGFWWQKLVHNLEQSGLIAKAEAYLTELGAWEYHTSRHALAAGILLEKIFQRHNEAEVAIRKSLELNPKNASSWNNLGNLLHTKNRYSEAEMLYKKALDINPKNISAWSNLGNNLSTQNRHSDAEIAYRKALELDSKDAAILNNLANSLNNQFRYKEAEIYARQALELDLQCVPAWNNLGFTLDKQHNHLEAETSFKTALSLYPQDPFAWTGLGHTLSNQGRKSEAIEAYKKAVEIAPQSADAWNNLGTEFINQNQPIDAENALRKAIEIEPENAYFWNNLGGALTFQNRTSEAENALRTALKLNPKDAGFWNALGNIYTNQQRHLKAKAAYRKALEISPTYAHAWNGLGNALLNQNYYTEAEAAFDKALKLDPNYAIAQINLAALHIETSQLEIGVLELLDGLANNIELPKGHRLLVEYWQAALPPAAAKIAANTPGADNLREALTEVLLERAAAGETTAVRDALQALDDTGQAIFEPLLLALQAMDDPTILYRIAREKRDLVQDVMKRIAPVPQESAS